MRALLFFIVSTTILGSSLWAGTEPPAPWNIGPPIDDPVYTPAELVASFRRAFGYQHGRVWHAKGIILEGEFTPDSHAKALTKASHLQGAGCKVIVRFSDFSGVPTIPDNDPLANPRGMAIRFELPGGTSTDVVAHSYNGFPVSNTDELRELILALAASGPGAPPPNAFESFLDSHPVARKFLSEQKIPASFATIAYYGVGSFTFVNARGQAHYARYQLLPEEGEELLTQEQAQKQSANYLMDEIKARLAQTPVTFDLYAQVAESNDKIKDLSIPLPDNRKRVLLGKIQIKNVTANTPEEDRALVFCPSNVPAGIEAADGMSSFYSKVFRLSAKEERDVAPVAGN
jgi:catalase